MSSPERLYIRIPDDIREDLDENARKHISRYKFASLFSKGDVLDIACGSGYGTFIIANSHNAVTSVTGIDRSPQAIAYANTNNKDAYTTYSLCDITKYEVTSKFDTVICIETFEHLPAADGFDFLFKIRDLVKPGGHFFLTTPMLRYKDGSPYVTNPYHLNEMPREKLITTIDCVFSDFTLSYYWQDGESFKLLRNENTGFLVVIGRKQNE